MYHLYRFPSSRTSLNLLASHLFAAFGCLSLNYSSKKMVIMKEKKKNLEFIFIPKILNFLDSLFQIRIMNFIRLNSSNYVYYYWHSYSSQSDEKNFHEIQKNSSASSIKEKVILNLHNNPNEENRIVSSIVVTKDQQNT